MSTEIQKEVTEVTEPVVTAPEAAAAPAAVEPAQKEAAQPDPETPPGDPAEGAPEGSTTPAAAPAYKPREKFKVLLFGSEEQKEFDVPEWLKATMKDEKSEKEAIELLEKAYGLETVKSSRAAVAKERDTLKGEYSKIQSTIQDVRQTYQRGDIDAFLQKLAIPQERMLQWALDKVNYSQLPPDQQRVLDERQEAQRRAWSAEQQTMTLEQQVHERTRQAKQVMLQSSLARPDVQSFAERFNAQAGEPDAFHKEIRATGELAWNQSNGQIDLTPDQAIEQVMKKWSKFLPTAQAASTQPAAAANVVTTPAPKPAVIPNVQGRTTSPMKSAPRSIADLRKLGAQAQKS